MLTVFTVLGLVVLMGRTLIYLVNTFFSQPPAPHPIATLLPDQETAISPESIAVITAAVELTTAGKGRVKRIELLSQEDDLTQ